MKLFLDWMGPGSTMEKIPLVASDGPRAVVGFILETTTGQRFEIIESVAGAALIIRSLEGCLSIDIFCNDKIKLRVR